MKGSNSTMDTTPPPAGFDSEIAGCLRDYSCRSTDGVIKAKANFLFPESFPAFRGHFPAEPILPGVVELYAMRYLASACLASELMTVDGDHVKFNNQVRPGDSVILILSLENLKDGLWKSHFQFSGSTGKISSGVITFAETE